MTTQLAIGYLAGPRRHPPGAGLQAGLPAPTESDSVSTRPAIPQAVITWSDAEAALPVGAGDPAAAIAGPPAFTAVRDGAPRLWRRRPLSLDALLFSVLVATLAGLAAAVVLHSPASTNAWVSYDTLAAMPAVRANVEVGERRAIESKPASPAPLATAAFAATIAN